MFVKKAFRNPVSSTVALAAIAACIASPGVMAAVVCNTGALGAALPASIDQNIDGMYANMVTGDFANGFVSNWDFNFYYNGARLSFWTSPGTANGSNQIMIPSAGSATAAVVSAGAPIGPAQIFNTGTVNGGHSPDALLTGGTGYIGIRFRNETTAAQNYGWVQLTVQAGSTDGFPVVVNGFCYDDTGAAINAGTTPVTLQNFSVD